MRLSRPNMASHMVDSSLGIQQSSQIVLDRPSSRDCCVLTDNLGSNIYVGYDYCVSIPNFNPVYTARSLVAPYTGDTSVRVLGTATATASVLTKAVSTSSKTGPTSTKATSSSVKISSTSTKTASSTSKKV